MPVKTLSRCKRCEYFRSRRYIQDIPLHTTCLWTLCSMCNGTGFINCDHCNGSGKVVCRHCKGMGELIVEREIIYDSESCKDIEISLNVPGSDKTITSFSKEDEKIILEAANFDDQSLGSELPHGYKATFIGYAPCFAVRVNLKGETTPFDFILCGKSLKPICKPPLLDVVFKEESNILSSTLNIGTDDVDEKIVCVKALAGKAILAKTIRSIENYELDIIKKEAAKQGVTVESILWENKNDLNNKAKLIKSTVKEQLIENVSLELISNAQGFISKEFSRYFAKNLIDFVPLLMMLNPNTKTKRFGLLFLLRCGLLILLLFISCQLLPVFFCVLFYPLWYVLLPQLLLLRTGHTILR